jgi:hypothetical protein
VIPRVWGPITLLAAQLLHAPFAFAFVDARRSFWKSCIGIDSTDPADRQNRVEDSFCQYSTLLARYTLRAAALQHTSPAHVLGLLDPALRDWFGTDPGRFVTLAYITLNPTPRGCSVRMATAGHAPVAVRRRNGSVELLRTGGPMLASCPR